MWGWAFKMNSRFSSSSSAANTCSTEIDTSEPGWKRQNIQYQLKKYCKNIYTVLWNICTWPHWACLMCIYIYKHHVDFLLHIYIYIYLNMYTYVYSTYGYTILTWKSCIYTETNNRNDEPSFTHILSTTWTSKLEPTRTKPLRSNPQFDEKCSKWTLSSRVLKQKKSSV